MKKRSIAIKPAKRSIRGEITVPGDKSISHRAVMIGSIAEGTTRAQNFLNAEDCLATIEAFKKMGVEIRYEADTVTVKGAGLKGLKKPPEALYLGNSGTTMRLLLGILAGQNFECVLSGDDSLSKRPMKRIIDPLRRMGAVINGRDDANLAPLAIRGGKLRGIDYISPVSSAQVKSSLLFAGLYAEGRTSVTEPYKSRDHTERMLKLFGACLSIDKLKVAIEKSAPLKGREIKIPGDISSAAFFIAAALLVEDSELLIRNVGYNQTRTGVIDIFQRMGGKIEIRNVRDEWEPVSDLIVRSSRLKAVTIEKSEIPRSIDELPIIMAAACFAEGRTVIEGASELRVKETDRINSMQYNLRKMGADISSEGDKVIIAGTGPLAGAELESFGDHRTAMAASIAALTCSEESIIDDIGCVDTSFPQFFNILKSISGY